MRIGFVTDARQEQLDWARDNGFGSFAWNRFETSAAGPGQKDWQPYAREVAGMARERGLHISAIGAHYRNPLDPTQSDFARSCFYRAIDTAQLIGVRTVCGFPGAVIELDRHPKGNNPIYKPFEQFIPNLVAFWEPIARYAQDRNVRLAFEHCPMGPFHLPIMGYNMLSQPAMWERFFDAFPLENVGIEWDASHLICQFIEPVSNIRKFGRRIFHVHAKDAWIDRDLMRVYGICHPGVAEHRFPGLGESNWAQIIHALLRMGYDSDLNIEGWHDPVFRDHETTPPADIQLDQQNYQRGQTLERAGLILARKHLAQFIPQ